MNPMMRAWQRRCDLALLFLSMTALAPCARAATLYDNPSESAKLAPSFRVPVSPLGFTPPSLFYLEARLSELSLNFIDKDHLLFTFRKIGLLHRIPNDPPGDEDQLIEAVVLDVASGKPIREAEWRMHDHSQYLWPLGDGKFLVRQRNTLYLTDSSLQLTPFLTFKNHLVSLQISPDRRFLTVESEAAPPPPASVQDLSTGSGFDIPPRHITIGVYVTDASTESHHLLLSAEAHHAGTLPIVKDGLLETAPAANGSWAIREIPFASPGQTEPPAAREIVTVHGNCNPSLLPLSDRVIITGCASMEGEDRLMTAIDLDGHVLWNQWWQAKYLWYSFDFSTDGSRFAMGSLLADRPISTLEPISAEDIVKQLVGVFDTATGKLVLVREADPIVSAGQNFALSADGRRFAILRSGVIEIYDLPPASLHNSPVTAKK